MTEEPLSKTQQASQEPPVQQKPVGARTELQKVATSFANVLEQYRGNVERTLADGVPAEDWNDAATELLGPLSKAERSFVELLMQTLRSEQKTIDEFFGDAIESGPDRQELEICVGAQGQWSAKTHSALGKEVDQLLGLQSKKARLEEFVEGYESKDEDFMQSYEAHAKQQLARFRQVDDDQVDAEELKRWTHSMLEAEIPEARAELQRRETQFDEHSERLEAALNRISSLARVVRTLAQ